MKSMSCEPRSVTRSWFSKWCFTGLPLVVVVSIISRARLLYREQPGAFAQPRLRRPKSLLVDASRRGDGGDLEREGAVVAPFAERAEDPAEVDRALAGDQVAPRVRPRSRRAPRVVLDVQVRHAFPERVVGEGVVELAVVGEELRVERDAAAIVRVERAVDVLERRSLRARDRLDRQRDAGRLRDVEACGQERQVLAEPAVADGELPEVEDDERRAEARGEPAVALELRERRVGVLEQLGADALVEVRRLEAKPGASRGRARRVRRPRRG